MQQSQPTETIIPEPLTKRVVKGGLWVFALRIVNRGLGFVRTIILARLLAPEDFGLLGIAMLAIATLETFSQTGLQAALIQKKEDIESYLDTAWTVSAVRGVVLFLILLLTAPLIADFFDSPQALLVIKVIAISTLLSGFQNIGIVFFQKELEFNKQFTYEFSGAFVDLAVSISLAFLLRNVWALVWGGLAANFFRLFMSYIIHPYKPRLSVDKEKIKDLFGFGKWVFGSTIVIFLATQGDDIFVGKIIGVTALGLYQMAYMISNLPTTEITLVISRVTFPAYSKMQTDLPRLSEAYLKVLQVAAFFAIPLSGGIFILAPEFTQLFLGDKWMQMVPAMQVLALAGLARAIISTTSPVFSAIKRPDIAVKCQTVRLILLAVLIYPLTIRWGILGASFAVLISISISALGFCTIVVRTTKCGVQNFIKMIFFPSINTVIILLVISYFKTIILSFGFFHFIILLLFGGAIYACITVVFDKYLNYGVQKLIKDSLAA